ESFLHFPGGHIIIVRMMRGYGGKILHEQEIELVAENFISGILRKMAKQKRAQHLLFTETMSLQQLTHLRHLHITIDLCKPFLDAVKHFPFAAVDWILKLLAMGNIELKFPN